MKLPAKVSLSVSLIGLAAIGGAFLATNFNPGGPAIQTKVVSNTTITGAQIGGPFTLTNHRGETVTEKDFQGKHMLVFFGFTNCPDICPTTMNEIAGALDALGDKADQLQAVFISVDPERDTPEALGEYMELFDKRITGLTGTPEQIAAAAKTFRIFYTKNIPKKEQGKPKEDQFYLVDHSAVTYLMSPDGEFIRHYSYGTPAPDLAKDLAARL